MSRRFLHGVSEQITEFARGMTAAHGDGNCPGFFIKLQQPDGRVVATSAMRSCRVLASDGACIASYNQRRNDLRPADARGRRLPPRIDRKTGRPTIAIAAASSAAAVAAVEPFPRPSAASVPHDSPPSPRRAVAFCTFALGPIRRMRLISLKGTPINRTIASLYSTCCSHNAALASLGMRQSPRGERLTVPTLGPSGRQERLN